MIGRYGGGGLALFAVALYGGPVLAGLARHGISVLPVFAALFLLYVAASRKPDLATGAGWAGLAFMAAVQAVLVSLSWAAGLAASAAFGGVVLPLWAPIALTAVAAGFGAWAWRDAAEMDVMLDSAIKAIEGMNGALALPGDDPWPRPAPGVETALAQTLDALRAVETPGPGAVDPIVQGLETETGAAAFDLFYDAAGREGEANEPAVDYGLLRYVASPNVLRQLVERGEGGLAPVLLLDAPHPFVRAQARGRVIDLVDMRAPPGQLPDPAWLAELHESYPGEGYDRLAALCARR